MYCLLPRLSFSDVTEVPYDKILAGHYEHVKVVTHRGHSGWTRKGGLTLYPGPGLRSIVQSFDSYEVWYVQ